MVEHTVIPVEGKGLGRVPDKDVRRFLYPIKRIDREALHSKRHPRYIPVLNQGGLGSCTGNAGTGLLGSGEYWLTLPAGMLSPNDASYDEGFAVLLYGDATKVDGYDGTYPPDDTGSSGAAIGKVLKARKLISGYTNGHTADQLLTALQDGPVIMGLDWYEGFDNPDETGLVELTGDVRGGHEIVADEIDVERQLVGFTNSWGTGWGKAGRFYMTWATLDELYDGGADCTFMVPVGAPAPDPVVVPPFWVRLLSWLRTWWHRRTALA